MTDETEALRAEIARLTAELAEAREALAEMTRRRDAWRGKAEGYDAVRLALREKVGAPWPPHLSRALWAGLAADEKKRADDAEDALAQIIDAAAPAETLLAHAIADGMIDEAVSDSLDAWCEKLLAALHAAAQFAHDRGDAYR